MGRHREFDLEQALDAALHVFWENGYEGASYDELSRATGVARPGLYAAFGNKAEFFRRAVERYETQYTNFFTQALGAPTAQEVVRRILVGSVAMQTRFPERRGCMIVNGVMSASEQSQPVREDLVQRRSAAEAALRARLERARDEGELPPKSNCRIFASYVMTVAHGIAVQAKTGASKATLDAIVSHALTHWAR